MLMSGEKDELTSAEEEKRLRFCVPYSTRHLSAIPIGVLAIVPYTTQKREMKKRSPKRKGNKKRSRDYHTGNKTVLSVRASTAW